MGKLTFIPLGGNGGGGERGYQGVQGAVGATGSQGIQGADGVGYQGVQGAAGLNGTDGFQGTAGLNGTDGFQGASGFQGTAGLNGINGEQGVQGATGASIQGLQGEKGSDGIQGGRGLQGEKGESIQGATGAQGTTGFQGTMGIQGPAGGGGGATRYDISTKSQAELAEFYQNWQTIMASNDVYFGVYPVVSVNPAYTQMDIGGVTVDVMLVEYNLQLGFVDDMPNIVSGKAGAWYILPNGMGGDYTAEMLFASKDYVDNGLQGKQDTLTAGEGISIQGTTISATGGGGGGSAWYGTQAEFDALQSVDTNTDYFISDPITWDEIADKPNVPTKISELPNDEGYVTDKEMKNYINEKKIMHIVNSHNWYGTQAEYEALQTLNPNTNYHIEGDEVSLQMTFTFTDSTQAVYDVFVRPTV